MAVVFHRPCKQSTLGLGSHQARPLKRTPDSQRQPEALGKRTATARPSLSSLGILSFVACDPEGLERPHSRFNKRQRKVQQSPWENKARTLQNRPPKLPFAQEGIYLGNAFIIFSWGRNSKWKTGRQETRRQRRIKGSPFGAMTKHGPTRESQKMKRPIRFGQRSCCV